MVVRGLPLALFIACALPVPGMAQDDAASGARIALVSPPDHPFDASAVAAGPAQSADTDLVLGNALNFDASTLATAPAKLRLPGYADPQGLDVSRSDRPDGSGTFTVKKPLPIDVETKFGADFAAPPSATFAPGQLPASSYDSGAAWASVGVPNLASIDARVDPNGDSGRVGTTLQRAVPIGSKLSVTLQNTFSVTDTMNVNPRTALDGPLLAALPPSAPVPAQVWDNENRLKFDILPTGTSLSGGVITSSIDPQTHNSFSADQKLYGALHVTTTVNDVGEATRNRSITAGFKLNW